MGSHRSNTFSAPPEPKAPYRSDIREEFLYRYLNEPEEAESICHDILAIEPDHQLALRMLGLAITDQFAGQPSDRYTEVEKIFQSLTSRYERWYYTGLLHERRAKAQYRAGHPVKSLIVLFEEAMHCFEEAEKIRPIAIR